MEFTQVFFSFHSKLKDQCLLLSPEKVAVVVAVVLVVVREGGWSERRCYLISGAGAAYLG